MAGGDSTRPDGGHDGEETTGFNAGTGGFADQETAQLELGDEDAGLPWLEGDDDDDEDYGGYNTGRLIGIALLGLLVLGAISGGIWWASNKMGGDDLVADGSVVQAPDTPYKQRPENPGGRIVDGTGDTSFAVAEGQTRPVRLGEASPSPTPTGEKRIKTAQDGTGQGASAAAAAAAGTSGVGVQVAAYSTMASAEAGWSKLSQQYEALSGLHYRIVEGQADIGTVYRLQAMAGDAAGARALCRKLRSAGLNCQVKS